MVAIMIAVVYSFLSIWQVFLEPALIECPGLMSTTDTC